jgi:hypothetical protein
MYRLFDPMNSWGHDLVAREREREQGRESERERKRETDRHTETVFITNKA